MKTMVEELTLKEIEADEYLSNKLLIPGWAGQLTDNEAAFIAAKLCSSQNLRTIWRTRRIIRRKRNITAHGVKLLNDYWSGNGG